MDYVPLWMGNVFVRCAQYRVMQAGLGVKVRMNTELSGGIVAAGTLFDWICVTFGVDIDRNHSSKMAASLYL